jgi:2-C-methyl-D-erythritol 2,4-cyclodiphosphate synthase
MIRSGIGIAIYPFAEDHRFILGGVEIDYEKGLVGNFDADVLAHAICDALLGAAALGDMQTLFPPDDSKYKDISGLKLLELVRIKLSRASKQVENIDTVVICPELDISGLKTNMTINITRALELFSNAVSIKFSNSIVPMVPDRFEGVAVWAICAMLEISEEEEEPEEESSEEEYYE